MQNKASRNESLDKWRTEKGRPPRSDKPWIPVGKTKNCSANSSFDVKSHSKVAKPKLPEVEKPIHTNFLKRRSGMCKWSHFGYSEDIKRRRVSSLLDDKENADQNPASVDASAKKEVVQVKPLIETPSVAGKTAADKNLLIQKTRRDLLYEWRKAKRPSKNASADSNGNIQRRKTISTASARSRTSPESSLRRQTMIISKKPTDRAALNNLPEKEPTVLKRSLLILKRRQTMVIQNRLAANVPKVGVAGPSKSVQIPRCVSQPVLNQQKAKESHLPKTGATKKGEPKTAASAGANRTNKARASLGPPHRKSARVTQSVAVVPSTSRGLTGAGKGPVQNARSSQTTLGPSALRSKTVANATLRPKSSSNKTIALRAKPSDENQPREPPVVKKAPLPPNAAAALKNVNLPKSKALIKKNAGPPRAAAKTLSRSHPKPTLKSNSKADVKMPDARRPQFCLPLDRADNCDRGNPKTEMKSNLGILKPATMASSNRKSVAFEIPVHDGSVSKSPSLRRRLSSWLESQGRTPAKFRHLHCFGVELSEMKRARSRSLGATSRPSSRETPTRSARPENCNTWLAGRTPLRAINNGAAPLDSMRQLDSSLPNLREESSAAGTEIATRDFEEALSNLSTLLDDSYSLQEATEWLDAMFEKTQDVCRIAAYWECRAKISELGCDSAEALALLARGVDCNAQPVDKLLNMRARLSETTGTEAFATPRQRRRTDRAMDAENVFSSTLIKYAVKNQTPVVNKLWPNLRGEPSEPLVTVTPVRRTHRRSSAAFAPTSTSKPSAMQCVTSLDDIPEELKCRMVLVPNPPLKMRLESPRQVRDTSTGD